jgi:hypothetical protein
LSLTVRKGWSISAETLLQRLGFTLKGSGDIFFNVDLPNGWTHKNQGQFHNVFHGPNGEEVWSFIKYDPLGQTQLPASTGHLGGYRSMTIYDLKDLLAQTLHDHEVSNGEFIPDATFTLTMEQGRALLNLLENEIDVRKRRASAGGKGFSSPPGRQHGKKLKAKEFGLGRLRRLPKRMQWQNEKRAYERTKGSSLESPERRQSNQHNALMGML